MDFFDNLGKKIADAGENVYQKGKNFADTQKANMDIKEEERRIEDLYAQIGRGFVNAHPTETEAEYSNYLSQIKAAQRHIEDLRENIRDIKHLSTCPKCGGDISQNAEYCPFCGAKL